MESEYHDIVLTSNEGKEAYIDFNKGKVTFSGELPVDEAAKIFFETVGEYINNKYLCK